LLGLLDKTGSQLGGKLSLIGILQLLERLGERGREKVVRKGVQGEGREGNDVPIRKGLLLGGG